MKDLIEALQILLKYGNPRYPTYCDHDKLNICGIEPSDVSKEDKGKLEKLGFVMDEESIYSYKFGSC